jgi:hypothetical protein
MVFEGAGLMRAGLPGLDGEGEGARPSWRCKIFQPSAQVLAKRGSRTNGGAAEPATKNTHHARPIGKDFSDRGLTIGRLNVLVLFMYDASVSIAPAPDDPEGRAEVGVCAAEARRERQLAMLHELAEIGMQMARAVRDEALAPAEAAGDTPKPPSRFGGGDLGLVYSRIARAVRQTLALESRVAEQIDTARVEHARTRLGALRRAVEDRQHEIRDYVAEAIEAEAVERKTPERDIERLLDDLDERLEAGDYDDALADGLIGDLVARICADLGVTPDWSLWEDQAWAIDYEKSLPPYTDIGAERWPRHDPAYAAAHPPDGPAPDSS